jgi:hypothetical protein
MPAPLFKSQRRRFTYAIKDNFDGKLYASINPNELQYAGLPSPTIDKNWNELIAGKQFLYH